MWAEWPPAACKGALATSANLTLQGVRSAHCANIPRLHGLIDNPSAAQPQSIYLDALQLVAQVCLPYWGHCNCRCVRASHLQIPKHKGPGLCNLPCVHVGITQLARQPASTPSSSKHRDPVLVAACSRCRFAVPVTATAPAAVAEYDSQRLSVWHRKLACRPPSVAAAGLHCWQPGPHW